MDDFLKGLLFISGGMALFAMLLMMRKTKISHQLKEVECPLCNEKSMYVTSGNDYVKRTNCEKVLETI